MIEHQLSVKMYHDEDKNAYVLKVKNSGVPIKEEIDITNTKTLGMQLISGLTAQIKGKVEPSGTEGTEFTITFPESA